MGDIRHDSIPQVRLPEYRRPYVALWVQQAAFQWRMSGCSNGGNAQQIASVAVKLTLKGQFFIILSISFELLSPVQNRRETKVQNLRFRLGKMLVSLPIAVIGKRA